MKERKIATSGDWRLVTRRKRFPDNWRTPVDEKLDKVRPYAPYKQTYAQVVAKPRPRPSPQGSSTQSHLHYHPSPPSNQPSRSSTPPTPPGTRYYTSPHSPTSLRFPPMATYPEWRGRCFRCLRLGHTAAQCCNPFKCAKCWSDGHIASKCLNTQSNSSTRLSPSVTPSPQQFEPSFDELLQGDTPPPTPILPDGRPEKVMCFIERDEEVYREIQNLNRAVVIHGERQGLLLEAHQIVQMAVETKLVREEEIRVAQLARERHLIHLPRSLSIHTFVKALPRWLWDQGFDIQQWSPLDAATVLMPRFKVLLDLEDFPIYLWKETQLIKAVSQFGIYLGSVQPEHALDFTAWRVSVATDDLRRIPMMIAIVVGGIEHQSRVKPIVWSKGPIYSASDFPELPSRLTPPPPSPTQLDNDMI
ncbi:hypothetical protein FCM35_KLT20640 [Carex littledalei]|uniref:CCHC-type domain-containing protein n=1 Tax=Carex littledalei TaxID=544730 RepID=A0A833VUV7_9POAL|nr:hypothetical protein FCM35_KLT20640 [Carex littledalei]